MADIIINFTKSPPCISSKCAGHIGEHRANNLVITPSDCLTKDPRTAYYRVVFENHMTIELYSLPLIVPLEVNLTTKSRLPFQVLAFDSDGAYLNKSDICNELYLRPSMNSNPEEIYPDEPSILTEIHEAYRLRHNHDNKETVLDKLSTNGTELLFDGEPIKIPVDSQLSPTSTNPVENRAIYERVNSIKTPIYYGVVNTQPQVAEKTVTVDSSFALTDGVSLIVKWNYASGGGDYASRYLNVNSTGPKIIRYSANSVAKFIPMLSDTIWMFTYNRQFDCWVQIGYTEATNLIPGMVLLSDSITDNKDWAWRTAATPKAVYLVHQEALSLENRLDSEIINREEADNNIQSQIDALVSKSDVVDVVGTYAELLAYDASVLGNNDVVKVLSDSTHDNTRSYYRWIIEESSGSWHYVGSESVGYTKAETDAALADKEPLSFHVEVENFDLEEGTVMFNKTFDEIYYASNTENRYVYLDIPQINHTIFDVTSITSTFISWMDVVIFGGVPMLIIIQILSDDSGSVSMIPLVKVSDIPDVPDVPTKVSDLTNDLDFQTGTQVADLILDAVPTIRKMVVQEDAGGYYVEVTTE